MPRFRPDIMCLSRSMVPSMAVCSALSKALLRVSSLKMSLRVFSFVILFRNLMSDSTWVIIEVITFSSIGFSLFSQL